MGSKTASPPSPPNPYDVANAQTQSNVQSALGQQNINAVNQQNPYGTLTYTRDPTTGQLTQTSSLNPASQFQLGAQQAGGAYLAGLGLNSLGNLQNTVGQPLNVNQGGGLTYGVQSGPIQNSFDTSKTNTQQLGQNQLGQVSGGSAYNFDTSNLPKLNQDHGAQVEQAYQLALNAQLPILNQLQNQQNNQLAAKLAGQGITQDSDAYNRQQQLLSQNQGQNYNSLANQAFGAGTALQNQLFGQDLSARNQLFGEQATQAQNQLGAQQLNTQASGQNAANQLGLLGLNNQAAGQQYNQNLGLAQFGNNAQQSLFNQNLAAGQFGNQANAQGIQNQMTAQQYPLQMINQLFGTPVNSGAPQSGAPQSALNAPNLQQGVQNYYGQQGDIYNAQLGQQNSQTNALASLAGTAALAFL